MKKEINKLTGRYIVSVKDVDFVDVLNIIENNTINDRALRISMKAKNGIKENTKWRIRFNATNDELEFIKRDLLNYKKMFLL